MTSSPNVTLCKRRHIAYPIGHEYMSVCDCRELQFVSCDIGCKRSSLFQVECQRCWWLHYCKVAFGSWGHVKVENVSKDLRIRIVRHSFGLKLA